mmetsp:Transcript_38429/g.58515  ORF Transcript_38429/g.58515 Transcript_38429/m.58515 type:complete len:88 (-) Transcript_38429:22-285(-)
MEKELPAVYNMQLRKITMCEIFKDMDTRQCVVTSLKKSGIEAVVADPKAALEHAVANKFTASMVSPMKASSMVMRRPMSAAKLGSQS